eukprot:258454-Lingulodinium_polyedra.AAC.1
MPLHEWLGLLMARPSAHWLFEQLVAAIAQVMDEQWQVQPDIFAPLQKSLAHYAHRCDPALRRAVFLGARARLGSGK